MITATTLAEPDPPRCPKCGGEMRRVPYRVIVLWMCENKDCLGYLREKLTSEITEKELDRYYDLGS